MQPYLRGKSFSGSSGTSSSEGVQKIVKSSIKMLTKRPKWRNSSSGYDVEKLYEANFLKTTKRLDQPPVYLPVYLPKVDPPNQSQCNNESDTLILGTYTRITSITQDSVLNDPSILKQMKDSSENAAYKYNSSKCKIKREISIVSRSNSIKKGEQKLKLQKRRDNNTTTEIDSSDYDKYPERTENQELFSAPEFSSDSGLDQTEFSQPPYLGITRRDMAKTFLDRSSGPSHSPGSKKVKRSETFKSSKSSSGTSAGSPTSSGENVGKLKVWRSLTRRHTVDNDIEQNSSKTSIKSTTKTSTKIGRTNSAKYLSSKSLSKNSSKSSVKIHKNNSFSNAASRSLSMKIATSSSTESNISLEPISHLRQDFRRRPELQKNMQRAALARNQSAPSEAKFYVSENNNKNAKHASSWRNSLGSTFTVFPKIAQIFQHFEYDEMVKMQHQTNVSLKRRVTFSGSTDLSLVY